MNKLNERFEKFQQSYDEAIAGIHYLLETDKEYEKDVSTLVKWLMETDINPYSFLPANWAECLEDAVNFYILCRHIHHALVDDGCINFIKINDSPRISFIEHYGNDEEYKNWVLTEQEKDWGENGFGPHNKKMEYIITHLKNVNEFITAIEEYETNTLKQFVKFAVCRKNLEQLEHYRECSRFNEEWIEEFSNTGNI